MPSARWSAATRKMLHGPVAAAELAGSASAPRSRGHRPAHRRRRRDERAREVPVPRRLLRAGPHLQGVDEVRALAASRWTPQSARPRVSACSTSSAEAAGWSPGHSRCTTRPMPERKGTERTACAAGGGLGSSARRPGSCTCWPPSSRSRRCSAPGTSPAASAGRAAREEERLPHGHPAHGPGRRHRRRPAGRPGSRRRRPRRLRGPARRAAGGTQRRVRVRRRRHGAGRSRTSGAS